MWPIVILLEATGFHLVDLLTLKLDCLQKRDDGYWIVSERDKIKSVPISEDIYSMVKAQKIFIHEKFSEEENPEHFLFLRYKGKMKDRGRTYLQPSLIRQLNIFAEQQQIIDLNGKIFRFGASPFRHRFGIKKSVMGPVS